MISSWLLFPLLLALLGLGWGAVVDRLAGEQGGVLTIPLGLATAIVLAALLTAFRASAPLAAPLVSGGALIGLALGWRRFRVPRGALIAAVGVVAIYGSPVILSGQATFLGYVRLDDTATWLAFVDQLFSHGRSLAGLPSSTYQLLLFTNLTQAGYPAGSFMLLGVGHWLSGIDSAWIFQPTLAVCAGALAMCCWALTPPRVARVWVRGLVSFLAAQSALLFGYAAWGGIKELTAAFLLSLLAAATVRLLGEGRMTARRATPAALAGAALIVSLGPGAAVYAGPAVLVVAGAVTWRWYRRREAPLGALAGCALAGALSLPVWLTESVYVRAGTPFTSSAVDRATAYGNLTTALRGIQLAGIWLDRDFRSTPTAPPSLVNHLLIYVVLVCAAAALVLTRRRGFGVALYIALALASVTLLSILGTVPWVTGKALAIASPAVLLAGASGAAIATGSRRWPIAALGVTALGAIGGGVLWSNYLQFTNVTLAPRVRLAELERLGPLVKQHGPTFFNEYEIYGDRHFLRAGAPVEPAEYRSPTLPTLGNAWLTKSAWANLDAFGLATLSPYRSLVLRSSPTESRPPALYGTRPVWAGHYYELWQQPSHPVYRVVVHYPLGDSTTDAYCGTASQAPYSPLCPIAPAAAAPCTVVRSLATSAASVDGELLAYERRNPIVVRATAMRWSAGWSADFSSDTLTPTLGGASATLVVDLPHGAVNYQTWLGGSFGRPFTVAIDGRTLGSVDGLNPVGAYQRAGRPVTLSPGRHTITVTYGRGGVGPATADDEYYSSLTAIALSPPASSAHYVTATPAHARALCGRSLDWLEVVTRTARG